MRALALVALAFACCVTSPRIRGGAAPGKASNTEPLANPTPTIDTASISSSEALVPKITFDVGVDDDAVEATIALMNKSVEAGAKAVVIEFNTPGGSVDAGFKLAKAIEDSPIPVHCVVDGMAASMGFYLLQSCSTRTMTSRSTLMAHEPAIGTAKFYGQQVRWQNIAELLRTTASAANHHLCHRMAISFEDFSKRIDGGREWWFTSEEALKWKAVDVVISDVPTMLQELRTTGHWLGK